VYYFILSGQGVFLQIQNGLGDTILLCSYSGLLHFELSLHYWTLRLYLSCPLSQFILFSDLFSWSSLSLNADEILYFTWDQRSWFLHFRWRVDLSLLLSVRVEWPEFVSTASTKNWLIRSRVVLTLLMLICPSHMISAHHILTGLRAIGAHHRTKILYRACTFSEWTRIGIL